MNQDTHEEHIYFNSIKEKREGYFVSYRPGREVASLSLTFVEKIPSQKDIKRLMIYELKIWITKYPIHTLVHAYNDKESSIYIGDLFETSLSGWIDNESGKFRYTWKMYKGPLNSNRRTNAELVQLFSGIPYRTQSQINEKMDIAIKERILGRNVFRYIYFLWLGVIPLIWGISQFFGPQFLTTIATIYCVWKFIISFIKTFFPDVWKEEPTDSEKIRLKDHYYYHCQLNPEGFDRLKSENFEKEQKQKIQKKYDQLAVAKKDYERDSE